MRPEQWQEVDRLFYAALERQPEERATFLEAYGSHRAYLGLDEAWLVDVEPVLRHFGANKNLFPCCVS